MKNRDSRGSAARRPKRAAAALAVALLLVWLAVWAALDIEQARALAAQQGAGARPAAADALGNYAGLRVTIIVLAGLLASALVAGGWVAWRQIAQMMRISGELDLHAPRGGLRGWRARLAALETLREGHAQLRVALDTMSEGLTVRSAPDGRLLLFNQAAARILHVEPEPAGEWTVPPRGWEAFDEDGRALAPEMLPAAHAARTGEACRNRVIRVRRTDGSELWLSSSATPLYRRGESHHYAVLTTFGDITSLKTAELAVRDSRRALQALVDNVAGVMYRVRWGAPTQPLYVSDGVEELTGHRAADIAARRTAYRTDIVADPADRARLDAEVEAAVRSGGRYETEYRIRCADGAIKWVLDRGRVVADDAGAPVIEGLITDITARKGAEDALRARSEQLRVILDSMEQGLTLRDAADRLIVWNRRFAELWELSEDALREGRTTEDLFRLLARRGEYGPGDSEQKVRERLAAVEEPAARVCESERPNGTVIEIHQIPTPSGGLVRVHTDITARRRAEAALRDSESRYRMLFDANPSPVFVFDADTYRILAANEAAIEHYGYDRKELLGMTIRDLRSAQEWERVAPMLRDRPEGARSVREARHRKRDGTEVDVEVHSHPLPFAGRAARIALAHDVTERKRVEREIAAKNAALEAILGNMSQGVSMWDAELRLVAWNDRYQALFRFPAGFLRPGLDFEEACRFLARRGDYGPGEVADHVVRITGLARSNDPHVFPLALADGKFLEVRSTPLAAGGGTLRTISDFTERHRAEEAIRRKSEQLESVLDNMADGVIMLDPELRLAAWNRAYSEIFGIPESAVRAGMPFAELTRYYSEGGGAGEIDVEETARLRASVREGGIAYSKEFRTPAGRMVDMRSLPVPSGGALRTYTDVTERKAAEEALRQRHALESLILSISTRFMDLNPEATDRAVEDALARVGTFVGADRCFVTELDENGRTYVRRFEWCAPGVEPAPQARKPVPTDFAWPAWQPLLKGEPFQLRRPADLPPEAAAWREILEGAGTRSIAIVPLLLAGRTVGSFGFDVVRGERRWAEEDMLLFRVVADLIASALERKRSTAALRFRADLEELVLSSSTRLISMAPDEIDAALVEVLELAGGFVGADRAAVALLDSTQAYRYIAHEWCAPGVASSSQRRKEALAVKEHAEVWSHVLDGQVAQLDRDALAPSGRLRADWEASGVRSSVALPLVTGGRVLGAFALDACRAPRRFGAQEIQLLRIIADTVAGAIERKDAADKLGFRLELEKLILAISTRFINVASDQFDAAIGEALERVAEFIGADRGHLDLLDPSVETYTVPYQWNAPGVAPALHRAGNQPARGRYSWDRLLRGEILRIPEVTDLPEDAREYRAMLEAASIRSLIGVPMVSQGRVIGAVGFDIVHVEEPWTDEVLPLLQVVADIFAGALERKQQQGALAASAALLRRTSAIARVGGWEFTPDANHLTGTAETARLFGLSDAPAGLDEMTARFAPAARPAVSRALERCLQEGHPFDLELPLDAPADRAPWVRLRGEAIIEGGRVRALAGAVQEITQRKRAELALGFRSALESRIAGISALLVNVKRGALQNLVVESLGGVAAVIGAERAWLAGARSGSGEIVPTSEWSATGGRGAGDGIGHGPLEEISLLAPRLRAGEIAVFQRGAGELPPIGSPERLMAERGVQSAVAIPLFGGARLVGAVGFESLSGPRDWTDETLLLLRLLGDTMVNAIEREDANAQVQRLNEELEQRVRQRTAQLEAMNEELESFSYSVSHDLRAPLRHIDGYSRILEQEHAQSLEAPARRFLARIRAAVERMGLLIDDMLALSRVTRAQMQSETVDLSSLAESIAQELFASAPERAHEWTIEPELRVRGDRRLLRVALQNLLENAWKYTRHAPVSRVRFGSTVSEDAPTFFIRDNGAGFDPAYAAKLFKPFQRLHGAEEFEGTGIGLATVHRILARHNGTVWAEGSPGEGATFRFRLP